MGLLQMGAITAIFLSLVLVVIISPVSADNTEFIPCSNSRANSDMTRQSDDIWYIYKTKVISETHTFPMEIIINGSGELKINNSATFHLSQAWAYQRNITVKENGILHLEKGTLISTHSFKILLEDNGQLLLEDDSNLKVSKINAVGNSSVILLSSNISPGLGGLNISINDEASLSMIDSNIINANNLNAYSKSKLKLENSAIYSSNYGLNCLELKLISNPDFRDLKVDYCENLYISGSTVSDLEIESGGKLQLSANSILQNSEIFELDHIYIQNSKINNVEINEIKTKLSIKNSITSELVITNCTNLFLDNATFQKSELKHFSTKIEIYESIIDHSSILPKNHIKIYNSRFDCTTEQLGILTRTNKLEAYNTSFNLPLNIAGTSQAHLTNCSTLETKPPKVVVYDEARVYIYWWLEVSISDDKDIPLAEVKVTVFDFIKDEKVVSGVTNTQGKVLLKLLGNTITKNGWTNPDNNTYYISGEYNNRVVEKGNGIWMNKSKTAHIKFGILEEKKENEKPFWSLDSIIGIVIFIIVLVLIGISLMGGNKKKDSGVARRKESRSSRDNEVNNGYMNVTMRRSDRVRPPGRSRGRRPYM